MLIVALVMAVIGLAALVTAVVTSNEIIAWVCIGASVIGVILLIVDAVRERQRRDGTPAEEPEKAEEPEAAEDYPEDHTEEEETEAAEAEPANETATSTPSETSEKAAD